MKEVKIGVYLDFDNFWGGLLREFGIGPDERKQKSYGLLPIEIEVIKKFLTELLSKLLYSELAQRFLPFLDEEFFGNVHVRYVKAFAVFSKLPFVNQVGDIQNLLHNAGIEPFPSFIAKNTKDASDRALILEVVEDVFFNKLPIDIVVIGSGDIDFYPLVSFFYEHSDKHLYILSFKNSLSSLYKKIPLTASRTLSIEALHLPEESEKFESFLSEEKKKLQKSIEKEFTIFKKLFLKKLSETQEKGEEIRTGLLFLKWRKDWRNSGYDFNNNEINHFLNLLQKERLIRIEPDSENNPLIGRIIKLGG